MTQQQQSREFDVSNEGGVRVCGDAVLRHFWSVLR